MLRFITLFTMGSSILWSYIRKSPHSLPFKFITRAIWYPTLLITSFNYDIIDDYIILGSIPRELEDLESLKNEGVTNIMSMNEDWELNEVPVSDLCDDEWVGIERVQFSTPDFNPPSLGTLKSAVDTLVSTTYNTDLNVNKKVKYYVHCKAGKGRSAIVVICYMMKKNNWDPETAIKFVKKHRNCISLNESQIQSIYEYHSSNKSQSIFTSIL